VHEVADGKVREHRVDPRDYGLSFCELEHLEGGDRAQNARILLGILEGTERGPKRDLVLFNAAAGLVITGLSADLGAGLELAREQIASGRARARLDALRCAA
jgi:anthranilate phosphoribosyltransferase